MHEGIDFYFDKKDDAVKFVDFLQSVIPCRYIPSQQLISHDTHSNTYKYKYTYSVEVVPVCKDDIMCLPNSLAKYLGNIGQICICLRITNNVFLIDPFTLKTAELNEQYYFRNTFKPFATSRQLTNYTVMEIEPIYEKEMQYDQHINRNYSTKHELADIWLIKTSELGKHENYVHTKTHLGLQLNVGDMVLGFDVANSNINDDNYESYSASNKILPDVIVVKKFYVDRAARNARRKWKLRRIKLDTGSIGTTVNNDFNDFMNDMEEDEELRANINIYKNPDYKGEEFEDDDLPTISVNEMLDEMNENSKNEANESKMEIS
jgi:nonsense-mediated mRNA decay protein 3